MLLFGLATAVFWAFLPEPALAWGPGTHVALGELVLGALHLLPPAVRMLLERHPIHFLYGSVAADISFAKKYVPEGRHCHNWHVGEEIHDEAPSEALQAVGLGYLAHLAADTVAHNLYVPRQLMLTNTTAAVGHTYWEHRMDVHVGDEALTLHAEGLYKLSMRLPAAVRSEAAKCRFDKKRRVLTVTMPTI